MSEDKIEFPEQYDETIAAKCQAATDQCQAEYEVVKENMAIMRESEQVLHRFERKEEGVSYNDVKTAKEKYTQARKIYLEKAKDISDGMPCVYKVALKYPDKSFLLRNYNIYLAKLLASREARNPAENMILNIAEEKFAYEDLEIELSANDERKGMTLERKKREYLDQLLKVRDRLESRYVKRQIASRLKKGESKQKILGELRKILKKDPDDIRTYLLLSNLLNEIRLKNRDHGERITLRQEAMDCLDNAFGKIDVYLDLQGVNEIHIRDQKRVGFVKTIAAMRKMLKGK